MKNPLGTITRYTYIDVYEKKLSIFFSRVLCLESPMHQAPTFIWCLVYVRRTPYTSIVDYGSMESMAMV